MDLSYRTIGNFNNFINTNNAQLIKQQHINNVPNDVPTESADAAIDRLVNSDPRLRGIQASFDPPYLAMRGYVYERISSGDRLMIGVTDDQIVALFMEAQTGLERPLAGDPNNWSDADPVLLGELRTWDEVKQVMKYIVPLVAGYITYKYVSTRFGSQYGIYGGIFATSLLVLQEFNTYITLPFTSYDETNRLLTSATGALGAVVIGSLINRSDPTYVLAAVLIGSVLALVIYYNGYFDFYGLGARTFTITELKTANFNKVPKNTKICC